MRVSKKNSIVSLLFVFLLFVVFSFSWATIASAATTPSLGAAATYGVLADTYSNDTGPTTIIGDVGFTTGPAVAPLGGHPSGAYPNYGAGLNYNSAGTDQAAALTALGAGVNAACTTTFPVGDIVLDAMPHGPVYTPGVYCITGAVSIGAGITLNGAGTYIFRSTGALNTVAGSIVTLAGTPAASACDVFWTPNGATTINANSTFIGTVIPVSQDITVYGGVATSWIGRALTYGHTVTTPTTNVNITVPTCAAILPPSSSYTGTINVVKLVINDNGGTKTIADFPLFVNGKQVTSGENVTFNSSVPYTVTETGDPNYTQVFSGDCDINGQLTLGPGEHRFCIITNNDIGAPVVAPPVPPLIDVVKVPSPLALPSGPGSVAYTYTLTNTGTVPVTDVTMVGDTCSPITLTSGDTNSDAKLDLSETWIYNCSTNLSETHTNTVVATGWANGLSATDIASATVVVGSPIVPPLIHVTKTPNPLTLPAGGGMVTYTKKVTNPGTVALSNVQVTDDKCSPISYISGDVNNDSMLDTFETWTYTCETNLTDTTTNTAIATGEANGLLARDFAIATVTVATAVPVAPVVPTLPKTGLSQGGNDVLKGIVIPVSIIILFFASVVIALRKYSI